MSCQGSLGPSQRTQPASGDPPRRHSHCSQVTVWRLVGNASKGLLRPHPTTRGTRAGSACPRQSRPSRMPGSARETLRRIRLVSSITRHVAWQCAEFGLRCGLGQALPSCPRAHRAPARLPPETTAPRSQAQLSAGAKNLPCQPNRAARASTQGYAVRVCRAFCKRGMLPQQEGTSMLPQEEGMLPQQEGVLPQRECSGLHYGLRLRGLRPKWSNSAR